MKKYINKPNIIILAIIVVFTISNYVILNNKNKELAKRDILIEDYHNKLEEEKSTLSPIEELSKKVNLETNFVNKYTEEIEEIKEELTKTEFLYELSLLRKACYTEQMNRMSQDLETINGYCEIEENLEQYRSKK